MGRKIKKWLDIIGTKNLIAICALVVVVIAVCVGVGIRNNNKKSEEMMNQEEESIGLQVEENADDMEGDSIDFEDFISGDEEDDKTDTDNDGVIDKEDDDDDNDGIPDAKDEDDNNDGTPDVEDPKHPSYEGTDKDEDKEDDDKDDDKGDEGGLDEEVSTDTGGFGPLF